MGKGHMGRARLAYPGKLGGRSGWLGKRMNQSITDRDQIRGDKACEPVPLQMCFFSASLKGNP